MLRQRLVDHQDRLTVRAIVIIEETSAAVGDEVFRRAPVTADKILMALEAGRPMHEWLTANV